MTPDPSIVVVKRRERGLPDGRTEITEPGKPPRFVRRSTADELKKLGFDK